MVNFLIFSMSAPSCPTAALDTWSEQDSKFEIRIQQIIFVVYYSSKKRLVNTAVVYARRVPLVMMTQFHFSATFQLNF